MSPSSDFALLVQQGIAAARSGRSDEARGLLQAVVRADPDNEMAWLWLSGLMTTDHQKRECLEHVLRTNPRNGYARAGLARLRKALRAEEEILEARLSSVAARNGNGPGPATLTDDQTTAEPASARWETREPSPEPSEAVSLRPGAKPERRGVTPRKRPAGKRQPKLAGHSYVTTCPSCDHPLPYTATACPYCDLTFTPLSEETPPASTARFSLGRSLKSSLRKITIRLRILK